MRTRAYFGSSGTADNSAPFPQARAVLATAAGTRGALGLESGPSADGEQTLTRRMVKHHPEVFAAGRLFLLDRNFPGIKLIKDIRAAGAHLLMRIKSDVVLPLLQALPDGSYRSFLADRDCCVPLRVIEYDVTVPGRGGPQEEMFALATTLTDWQAYPAAELAGLYPRRWGASETTIGQDKSAITGARPSRGPILRSGTAPGHPGDVGLDHRHPAAAHPRHPRRRRAVRMRAARHAGPAARSGPGAVHPDPPRGRPRNDPDPGARHPARRARRCSRARQPPDPRQPDPNPAAAPPRAPRQDPPAVPRRRRPARSGQHWPRDRHHLARRAYHLRRRPHRASRRQTRPRHVLAATTPVPATPEEDSTARPAEPAPRPVRYPGCRRARPHKHNSQTGKTDNINPIQPIRRLTPKSDGVAH